MAYRQFPVTELEYKRPLYPIMFPKFPNAVSGFQDNVVVPRIAQDDQADYEIELAVVIGKEAKNVLVEEADDYILGYTVSNDMSTRKWQLDPKLSGQQPQMSFSKSFDGFLPLGPCIVSAEVCFWFSFVVFERSKCTLYQNGSSFLKTAILYHYLTMSDL